MRHEVRWHIDVAETIRTIALLIVVVAAIFGGADPWLLLPLMKITK